MFSNGDGVATQQQDYIAPPKRRRRPTTSINIYSDRKPDGYFNSHPVYLETNEFHSTVHCIGQTPFDESSWIYRSCEYTYMCIEQRSQSSLSSMPSHNDFFLVSSSVETDMQNMRRTNSAVSSPSVISTELASPNNGNSERAAPPPVALGGINPRWVGTKPNQGIDKVRWSPRVVDEPPKTYFRLDDDVVILPFHSFAGHNVGHLLWDDFWPIYTLAHLFGYIDGGDDSDGIDFKPLLLRVDTLPKLFASCEIQPKKKKQCQDNFEKFLPLLGIDPKSFTTLTEIQLTITTPSTQNLKYPICAKHALAGIGMLTDHGKADHGWYPKQADPVHNIGRGAQYYRFRNYMLRNMGLAVEVPRQRRQQNEQQEIEFRIILNGNSSRDAERRVDFQPQLNSLKLAFPTTEVVSVTMKELDLMQQLELISQSPKHTIFVSTNGGGSMTGFFLPRGSSVIFYYNEQSGFDYDAYKLTGGPALLDWDLFNNLSYLRVHWLPIGTPPMGLGSEGKMNTAEAIDTLTYLIRHEMDVVINSMI